MRKHLDKTFRLLLENRFLNRWTVLIIDIFIILFATICSNWITRMIYNDLYVIVYYPPLTTYLILSVSFNLFFFIIFKTYIGIVRYSTIREIQRILMALSFADILLFFYLYKVMGNSGSVSLAYCTSLFLMSIIALYGFRIFVVYVYRVLLYSFGKNPPQAVHIWGVDQEGDLPVLSNGSFEIKGFITNDKNAVLKNRTDLSLLIISNPEELVRNKIKGVLFTNEKLLKQNMAFVEEMLNLNVNIYISQLKNIDNVGDLSTMNNIRPIQIEDLLGRPEISISYDLIAKNVKNKIVLVTGAAGSIGSEIVRQLSHFEPKLIICLDQAETPLNELVLELNKNPQLNFTFVMGDIRNQHKMEKVFEEFRPQIVYHAAAYKHVPMMEHDPCEAISTNVVGTKNLVDLSIKFSVQTFIMVSTDKAVNPTNIMGCSKRIAEIYVQSSASDANVNGSHTKFVTTRFGNVLGSNGSVIPLFRRQIEAGGPLTVTDPGITRYFMTIPEACRLVLEASVIGESGYIYVFDMGKPVKIKDLANKMIKLAGLVPGKDIEIKYTGLRPGEKLYEELLNDLETTIQTEHEKILIAKVREYRYDEILPEINRIIQFAMDNDSQAMVRAMQNMVPEFKSTNPLYLSGDESPQKAS